MTKILVRSWVPIRKMIFLLDGMPNDFVAVLEDFVNDLPSALLNLVNDVESVEVQLDSPPENVLQDLLQLVGENLDIPEWYEFIRIDCVVNYELEVIQSQSKALEINEGMLSGMAACLVSGDVADALCLAQLAYPMRIKSAKGRSWIDGEAYNAIKSLDGFPYDLLSNIEGGWPNLGIIKLSDVSSWEVKLGLFDNGVAKTPVQRALASFTHACALPTSSRGEALFWAMQGLEAFYCRGTGDLRNQLSEKSKIFLGPWNDKKNIVGKMYDFRSKFVHGSFNLQRWNNNRELEDFSDEDDFYAAYSLAIRMLFATLHQCVIDDIAAVDFEYKISPRKLESDS
ncbi:hypothetical protein [Paracidovorax oryzae]|uniref:hypothetical protein n=1 Tax=Paracidovorax oryzae TaxID=862720 RepID=UPI0035D0272E